MAEAKARRIELERRDRERAEYREKQNVERAAISQAKRIAKENKIKAAKDQAEVAILETRKMFAEREA